MLVNYFRYSFGITPKKCHGISSVKQTWFSDPKESNPGPVIVILAADNQIEDKQVEESCDVVEPMEDIPRMVVAIETPETEVIEESQLNGKSNSLLNSFRIIIYLFIFVFVWHQRRFLPFNKYPLLIPK